jgi:hypothetical protein
MAFSLGLPLVGRNSIDVTDNWDEQVLRIGETMSMKKPVHYLIAEVPPSNSRVGMTIGIDLGDVWSHYCTLNEDGEVVDRGRFRTTPTGVEKWFTELPRIRFAMEAGTHSIWVSEQLRELGHEVIVAKQGTLPASRDVGCYLGLRPRRSQSGDSDPQLGITKAGNV